MSMSRHEVNQLFKQMQERSQKLEAANTSLPLGLGLQAFEARLKKEEGEDKPSLALRQQAQLTKHYLGELESKTGRADPVEVFVNYNVAMTLHGKGFDVQYCIRRARAGTTDADREIRRLGLASMPVEEIATKRRAKANPAGEKKPDKRKQATRHEVPHFYLNR